MRPALSDMSSSTRPWTLLGTGNGVSLVSGNPPTLKTFFFKYEVRKSEDLNTEIYLTTNLLMRSTGIML
jgi:hypothetical protein